MSYLCRTNQLKRIKMDNTICFYVSYYDAFYKRRMLSNGYIIPGKTKEDAINYLNEIEKNFYQDIQFEYFAQNTLCIDNSILLDLFNKFNQ